MIPVEFPSCHSLAQLPTPLQPMRRLSRELGGPTIWLKRDDLTGCALSGNKIRKLEFIVAKALSEGADTLITCGGIQSNHCRATALVAAQLGLKCQLILRQDQSQSPQGNLLLDQLAGADIDLYESRGFAARLAERLQAAKERCHAQGRKAYVIPTGASDGVGIWGYVQAAIEIQQDCLQHGIQPGYIISATGSGGTQAGLTLGAHLQGLSAQVVGYAVCDNAAYFQRKVRDDIAQWCALYPQTSFPDAENLIAQLNIAIEDGYIGPGYAQASPQVFACMRHVASTEGVILDPVYTGKAFYGLMQDIRAGHYRDTQDLVFVHTGGLFGTFAQADLLAAETLPTLSVKP